MIHLVVALIHEARPLIDRYRLGRRKGKHPYVIYGNAEFMLIISGIGKVSSGAATAYLQALSVDEGPAVWLNLGIAGHRDFEVGTSFIAQRIIDQATGYAYYPPLIFPFPSVYSDLITVDSPEKDYETSGGYDMEASGYYKVALNTSTIEWIHCYKIVSDMPGQSVETLTKSSVMALISAKMNEIVEILSMLRDEIIAYRQLDLPSGDLALFTQRWHFTETQLLQLKTLMRRGRSLYGERSSDQFNLDDYQGAKSFLTALKQQFDTEFLIKGLKQTI